MMHPNDPPKIKTAGGLQVCLVWSSLVSTWRRRNRGIPWMPLGRRHMRHMRHMRHRTVTVTVTVTVMVTVTVTYSCDGLRDSNFREKEQKARTDRKRSDILGCAAV